MKRIFNLFNWFTKFLLAAVIVLIAVIIIFLNNPSLFIDDIEEITSKVINQNLSSNIEINITSIDGDFVSGFYGKNINVYLKESLIGTVDSIYINPNISDLFLFKISFSNISLISPQFDHNKLPKANMKDYVKKDYNIAFNNQIPMKFSIDKFFIDNGVYILNDKELLFNAELECLYSKNLNLQIKSFEILFEKEQLLNINNGAFSLSKDYITVSFPDYKLFKSNGHGKFHYDRVNKEVTEIALSLKKFIFPKHGVIQDIMINLTSVDSSIITLNNSFSYNSNTFISTISLDISEPINNLLSTHLESLPESDADYDLDITLRSDDVTEIGVQLNKFNYNSILINDLKLQCTLGKNFTGMCEFQSLDSIVSSSIKFNNLTGIIELEKDKFSLRDIIFQSDVGNGEIYYAEYTSKLQLLDCKLNIENIGRFTKLFSTIPSVKGEGLQAKIHYYDNNDSSAIRLNIQSKNLIADNLNIKSGFNIRVNSINKSLEYEATFYETEFLKIQLDTLYITGNGTDSVYTNSIKGHNILTGENINSNFNFTSDSTLNIEFIKGKLKDVPFNTEKIRFHQNDGIITSSPLTIHLGLGSFYSQINFKDFENYSLNLRASQINLVELKKIFQLQDRINGEMNGELNLSYDNSQPTILTNLNFRDGNFDDILFQNFDIQASFMNERLTLSHVDIDTDIGQLVLSGWLNNTGKNFSFNENDILNISGDFDKFEIKYLMRYLPWEQKTAGLLSGKIRINGSASAPKINLNYTIENPSFDKINADNISGNLIYKDKRLYLKAMNLKTFSGKYTGTGSIPADLNFVNNGEMNMLEQPLDFIFTGKSNSFEFLTPYIEEIQSLDGEFTMQLGLSGTLKKPIRGGQISIQNANLELLQLDNNFESLSGIATISNNKLIIKKLSGKLIKKKSEMDFLPGLFITAKNIFTDNKNNEEDNNLIINGTLDLDEFFNPNYTISIDGKNIYLNSTYGQFEGKGDVKIFISGKDTLLVTGEFKPSPNNFKVFSIGDDYNIDIPSDLKNRLINYNIHIPFQDGIVIDTEEVNMTIDGDMNIITVNNDELTYSGKINIVDGTFNYNNNEFSQATGNIILDPSKSSPYAEINAQTELVDENIDVTFIGFLDNPNLILESSSQQYSQSDILRLLTFKETNMTDEPSATGQIGELMANYIENELEKNVSLYTELDEFKLNRSGSLISGLEDSKIDLYLGKRISSNLYLNTRINLNQSDTMNEYELLYRLNRNMSIVARVDEDQYWHINYRYKYKY